MAGVPSPVVRYMIVCDDILTSQFQPQRPVIVGLTSVIESDNDPPYPFVLGRLCVLLVLTEARGSGHGHLQLVYEETDQLIWQTPPRLITFPADPLEIHGVIFRVHDCRFPHPGLYTLRFLYEGQSIAQQPLRLR
jgi:hypothetical protein